MFGNMSASLPASGTLPDRTPLLHGLRIRVVSTILLLFGGALFIILYLGFLATNYPWYENLAVVLAAFLVVPAALAAMWVSWGMALGRRAVGWSNAWNREHGPQ